MKKRKKDTGLSLQASISEKEKNGNIWISCDRSGLLYDPWCFRLDEDGSWNHKRCV